MSCSTPVSDKSNKTGDSIPVFVVIIVQYRKKCKNIFYKNFTRFFLIVKNRESSQVDPPLRSAFSAPF